MRIPILKQLAGIVVPIFLLTGNAQAQIVNTTQLQSAIATVPATNVETVIQVGASFAVTSAIRIPANKNVKLTSTAGSSRVISRGTGFKGHLFVVETDGKLSLENLVLDGGRDDGSTKNLSLVRAIGAFAVGDGAVLRNNDGGSSYFVDTRDNQTYRTVEMPDGKTWMAENLNYNIANGTGSWCYGNSADSCAKYGRLYNWATAMGISTSFNSTLWNGSDVNHRGICPAGWHLPNDAEWAALINGVGGSSTYTLHVSRNLTAGGDVTVNGGSKATRLKSSAYWQPYSHILTGIAIPVGTDDYGFSVMPSGGRSADSHFMLVGENSHWWRVTQRDMYFARTLGISFTSEDVVVRENSTANKLTGLSVRCVRDTANDGCVSNVNCPPLNIERPTLDAGTSITMVATANSGYRFVNWTAVSGSLPTGITVTDSVITFNIDSDVDIMANFQRTYTLQVSSNPTVGGNVTVNGDSNYPGQSTHDAGTSITIRAAASSGGWGFVNWTSAIWSQPSPLFEITFNISRDVNFQANFALLFNPNIQYGTLTDPRDGKTYRTVVMPDGKTWMAENLNYVLADTTASPCYENNPDYCAIYGRLYRWTTAMNIEDHYAGHTLWGGSDVNHKGICPPDGGWRLPSKDDWTMLISMSGSSNAGTRLKSSNFWTPHATVDGVPTGTDFYGFSGLPGGQYNPPYNGIGNHGSWWTATERDVYHAIRATLSNTTASVLMNDVGFAKHVYVGVRCLMD